MWIERPIRGYSSVLLAPPELYRILPEPLAEEERRRAKDCNKKKAGEKRGERMRGWGEEKEEKMSPGESQ
ncbi:hypothetical protein A3H56_03200 [Candidatus Nomurabacteria bacterium RIFCSPLOWO2_02_FULL_42_24]|nr:MAG: hypothetical protein A3H56_03200 [Candidatus Nomurabacteria bacterium RIFCSPLOWO2_02_FULL_42_24]